MGYQLNGLTASNPQGWMAAVGIILILDKMGKNILLSWEHETPVLHGIDPIETVEALLKYKEETTLLDNLPPGLPDKNKSKEKWKSALDFTAANVAFDVVIKDSIIKSSEEKIKEAIDAPWLNKDDITSLGWDTGAVKRAASLPGENPPNEAKHRGVVAGQWLAAESLSLTSPGYRVRNRSFTWTTWEVPLDFPSVRAIVFSKSCRWGGQKYESKAESNGQFNYFVPSKVIG